MMFNVAVYNTCKRNYFMTGSMKQFFLQSFEFFKINSNKNIYFNIIFLLISFYTIKISI